MTGRIVTTQYISLDGVIEDPVGMEGSGLGDWTGPFTRGPDGDAFKHRELLDARALLFGRRTYDAFAAVWPEVDDEAGYARRMNALPKYVASRTLEKAHWHNTEVLFADLAEDARSLRETVDGDILVFGSASVVHLLASHDLVDEYRLMVYPTVLGRGIRLFPDGVATMLSLAETRPFGDGIVLLRYLSRRR